MFDSSIDDRLHRLNEEFHKLLGNFTKEYCSEKTTPEQLIRQFGLTMREAEAWLKNEPNFIPSDDSYHDDPNRRKVTRTCFTIESYALWSSRHRLLNAFMPSCRQAYVWIGRSMDLDTFSAIVSLSRHGLA
jgi:hypothetical protein